LPVRGNTKIRRALARAYLRARFTDAIYELVVNGDRHPRRPALTAPLAVPQIRSAQL